MKRIIKEMKPFIWVIIAIIGLLFFQAMSELALPDYMSRIVNVGIQQEGIEEITPKVMRKSSLEKIRFFLTEKEKKILDKSYQAINSTDLTEQEYVDYIKKYPLLESEELYIFDSNQSEDISAIKSSLSKAELIIFSLEVGIPDEMLENQGSNGSAMPKIPAGMDLLTVLKNMPASQLEEMKKQIESQFSGLPDSFVEQAAVQYIKEEYRAIGLDLPKTQFDYIMSVGGIMLLIALIGMIAALAVGFLSSRVAASLGRNLREKIFTKVMAFSNSEFNEFSTASLITRSTNDIQQIQNLMVMALRLIFYAPILGIGGIIRALNTNVSMAWTVGVGVVGVLILIIGVFIIAVPKFKAIQKLVDKVNRVTREALNGMMVIRAFNAQKHEEDKFEKVNRDLTRTNLFVSRVMAALMPAMMLVMNATMILIVWFGAKEINAGTIQIGDIMAFMQYAMQIIMSFLMISMIFIMLPRAAVAGERIGEIYDLNPKIVDPKEPVETSMDIKGIVKFEKVSFKYPGAEEYALKDISFTANPGEMTAFIGSTGSGKTSLVQLIPRFFDVSEGKITIDGIDIRDMKIKELRDKIGYAPQDTTLFKGTIKSNILLGKNKDLTDNEVNKAIEISQAKEFVEEKAEGLLSKISQSGTNVSGGQKQRLSIARAIANKSKILIFDDSFSALDYKTDRELRMALKNELRDSTILTVAQRINTIKDAAKIIVLDESRVVGMGTHKELMQSCEVYRQIALSQLSEEELDYE